jgi:four helix bundle protein
MTYQRFEDLPVWNAAQELAVDVFALVDSPCFANTGDLRDQVRRSSLSISSNIAEGFERGSTAELLCYLYIARGSAGETRSIMRFAARLAERGVLRNAPANLRSQISDLIPRCESVSRQIRGWADSLQNCDISGQRHLNDASRLEYDQRHRAADFLRSLKQKYPLNAPPSPGDEQT